MFWMTTLHSKRCSKRETNKHVLVTQKIVDKPYTIRYIKIIVIILKLYEIILKDGEVSC